MYKLAIFDMDGTILNTLEDLKNAVNHSLGEAGFPKRSLDEGRRFVGNGLDNLVRRAVPEGTGEEKRKKVREYFDDYYSRHCLDVTRPYDGIPEVIKSLRAAGIKTACVSNKPDYGVQTLVERFFKGLFDYAVGIRPGMRIKPAPDAVYDVLKALETSAEESVYIGDSDVDLATAQNSGMDCISVLWGFRDREFLLEHGARVLAQRPEELLRLVLQDDF